MTAQAAASTIRDAVEGLAEEIGRRCGERNREELRDVPGIEDPFTPAYQMARDAARSVLLDYLLGDFNPRSRR